MKPLRAKRTDQNIGECKHPCFVEKTEIPQSRGEFGEKLFANTAGV